jgi:hypothetical protein
VRILLPKASKGVKFDLLFTIDMNDFDVEMLLPSLFHLVRTKGRRVGKPINPDEYKEYFDRMSQHERLVGFSSFAGRKVLDRWVRTSIVRMGKRGLAHTGEKMTYLYPTTMLSYKAGLPKEITRLRGVHNFVYTVLQSVEADQIKLDRLFREALGEGLIFDDSEKFDGRYDGKTEIDIEAMLTICFLDGLPAAGVSALPSETKSVPRLGKQSEYFARDIIGVLRCYKQELSTTQLNGFLLALINFHLFVYSIRLMNWVIGVSSAGGVVQPPEFFLDCTGERGSFSDELARGCVERDLEMIERYMRASLRLRTLDRFLSLSPAFRAGLPNRESDTSEYLNRLCLLADEVKLQARADQEFEQICAENGLTMDDEGSGEREETEAAAFLKGLRDSTDVDPIDRLVRTLFEAQRKSAMKNMTGWFYSVSGFNRSYGILSGNARGARRVARYTLSNELLSALVHVALADDGWDDDGKRIPAIRISLKEFLVRIEKRYGLLIDKPPASETSAEAVEAARRNLEAFKVRLRQIGVFENLSDDFDAQYLQRPMQVSWSEK